MSDPYRRLQTYLEEAAQTLRRLPRGLIKARLTSWPEFVKSGVDFTSPTHLGLQKMSPPAPAAIDRMDKLIPLLYKIPVDHRRLVWARAHKIPWRALEDMTGLSHTTLRKRHAEALGALIPLVENTHL